MAVFEPSLDHGAAPGNARRAPAMVLAVGARKRFFAYNLGMIPQFLFDRMACPACIKPLVMTEQGEGLKCTECHRVYPVRGNVPVMLLDQATIEP